MGVTERELCLGETSLYQLLSWFAVTVKPQHERAVQEAFQQKGFESFSPSYCAAHRWSDRVKRIQLPLFPGYVFCRFERTARASVMRTVGVRSIVSFGAEPVSVPEEEIQRIRLMVSSKAALEPWPFLKIGQRIRVHYGPLAGLEGILAEAQNGCRVVVGIDLLQRSVAVQLNRDQIRPA